MRNLISLIWMIESIELRNYGLRISLISSLCILSLNPSFENNTTKIDIVWGVDMAGMPVFARAFAKDNFMKMTEEALGKITQTVE